MDLDYCFLEVIYQESDFNDYNSIIEKIRKIKDQLIVKVDDIFLDNLRHFDPNTKIAINYEKLNRILSFRENQRIGANGRVKVVTHFVLTDDMDNRFKNTIKSEFTDTSEFRYQIEFDKLLNSTVYINKIEATVKKSDINSNNASRKKEIIEEAMRVSKELDEYFLHVTTANTKLKIKQEIYQSIKEQILRKESDFESSDSDSASSVVDLTADDDQISIFKIDVDKGTYHKIQFDSALRVEYNNYISQIENQYLDICNSLMKYTEMGKKGSQYVQTDKKCTVEKKQMDDNNTWIHVGYEYKESVNPKKIVFLGAEMDKVDELRNKWSNMYLEAQKCINIIEDELFRYNFSNNNNNTGSMTENEAFGVLEIGRGSSKKDIRKGYRKLARMHHPDKNRNNKEEAEKKMKKINEAYEILTRKLYQMMNKIKF